MLNGFAIHEKSTTVIFCLQRYVNVRNPSIPLCNGSNHATYIVRNLSVVQLKPKTDTLHMRKESTKHSPFKQH